MSVRSSQAMEREDNKDKPADKDDTKDSEKQQQKPVSRGGEEEEEGDYQDGSEEQDTASASSKKGDGKRYRPDSTSSLTRDVRHDPMHAVAESGLEIEPEEGEGSCEDEDTPIPKASQQARADQLEKSDAEIRHLKRELAASEAECRAIRTQFDAVTYDRAVIQSENLQASIYKSDFDTERHDRAEAVGRMAELQRRHDDQCSTKEAAEKELREVRKKIKAMQENFHRDVDYHRRRTEDLSSELQLRKVEATSAMEECDRKQSSLKSKDARIVILEAQHEELRTLSERVERARQDTVDSEKSSVHTPSVYGSPDHSLKLPDRVPPHRQPDHVPPHEQPGHVLSDSVPPRKPSGRTTTERLNELSVELEEMHTRDREDYEVLHKAKQVLEEQNQRLVRVTTEHGLDPSGGGGGGGQQQPLIYRQEQQLSASMPRMQQAMKGYMLEQRSRSVGSKFAAFQRDGKSYVGDSPPIVEGEVFQTPPSQAPLNHTQQPDLKGFDTPPPPPPSPAPAPPFSSQAKPQQQFDHPVQKPKMRFANPQASQSSQSAEYANYPTNQGPQSMRPADQYTPASSERRQQVRPQLLYQGEESRQQKRQQHPQRGGYNQFGSQGGPNASPLRVSTPTPQHASLAGYNHQSLASNQRGGFMSLNPAGFQATGANLQFQSHARQPPDAVRSQARGGRYGTDQRAHIFQFNSEDLLSYPRYPNRQHVPRSMSRIEGQEDEIETQSLPLYSLPPNAPQMSAEDYQEFVAFKHFQQEKLAAIQQQPGSEGRRKQQHSVRNLGPEFEKQSSKRGVARGYPLADMIAGAGEEGGARSDPTVEENTLSKGIDTGDVQGPSEAIASSKLTTDNTEPLPEEAEVASEDSNKTDMQKMEHLQQQFYHLQKQLESTTTELAERQRSLKQAEDHVVKLTADLTAKTSELDEVADVVIANKLQAEVKAKNDLLQLTQSVQAGSEEDTFKKVKERENIVKPNETKKKRVPILEARRVWGTMRCTSSHAVSVALKLTNIDTSKLVVKRKFKCSTTKPNCIEKWWFIVRGEEELLCQLEEKWGAVAVQTAWKLQPAFMFVSDPLPVNPVETGVAGVGNFVSLLPPPNQQKGVSPALKPSIDQVIQEVATDVVKLTGDKRAKEVTNFDAPFDPNLVCPMCDQQFRIGEIQKYKHHVPKCKGSSGLWSK